MQVLLAVGNTSIPQCQKACMPRQKAHQKPFLVPCHNCIASSFLTTFRSAVRHATIHDDGPFCTKPPLVNRKYLRQDWELTFATLPPNETSVLVLLVPFWKFHTSHKKIKRKRQTSSRFGIQYSCFQNSSQPAQRTFPTLPFSKLKI